MKLKVLKSLIDTGRMASVDFITKSGKLRTINGRTQVKRHTTGKGAKYNAESKGMLTIWETLRPQDKERGERSRRYRNIKAENVRAIRADGVEIKVK